MLTNRRSRSWDDDRHVLVVNVTGDPDYPLELEVEHPQSCKVAVGCIGPCFNAPDGEWHVDWYYDCPVGHQANYVGVDEALFGLSLTGPKGYRLMEEPSDAVGPVWEEVCRRLDAGDEEMRIPMKLHWSGSYDYWGEWDELLEVECLNDG